MQAISKIAIYGFIRPLQHLPKTQEVLMRLWCMRFDNNHMLSGHPREGCIYCNYEWWYIKRFKLYDQASFTYCFGLILSSTPTIFRSLSKQYKYNLLTHSKQRTKLILELVDWYLQVYSFLWEQNQISVSVISQVKDRRTNSVEKRIYKLPTSILFSRSRRSDWKTAKVVAKQAH